jgi:hypothetical protein
MPNLDDNSAFRHSRTSPALQSARYYVCLAYK